MYVIHAPELYLKDLPLLEVSTIEQINTFYVSATSEGQKGTLFYK